MKRPARILFPLVAWLAGSAVAQVNTVPPEDRNAALKYWAAWSAISPELGKKAGDLDWAAIGSTTDKSLLPAELRETSESAGHVSLALIEASRLEKCDFEIEYEKGVMVLLPHLGKARQSARILRADARWLVADGKPEEAAERIATLFRIAGHLRADRVMISSLVGAAIGALAVEEASALLASGQLNEASRGVILRAVAALDPADPYDVGRTLQTEREVFTRSLQAKFTGPDAGKHLIEELGGLMQADESSVMHAARMAVGAMDGVALAAALSELDRYYQDALAAWDRPDADEVLNSIGESVSRNGYGPLAMVLAPSLTKARESTTKTAARLAELREQLEAWKPAGATPAAGGK